MNENLTDPFFTQLKDCEDNLEVLQSKTILGNVKKQRTFLKGKQVNIR